MIRRQIPLLLTLSRLAACPWVTWLLIRSEFRFALVVVLLAGLTDWFDGYTARLLGVSGKMGVVLDPLADKILLVTLFFSLGYIGRSPVWLVCLVIGRDLVIVTGVLLLRVFRNIRRFVPRVLGKVSTFFQITYVLLVLLEAAFPYKSIEVLQVTALALTTFFTFISGIDYVRLGIQLARRVPARTGSELASE